MRDGTRMNIMQAHAKVVELARRIVALGEHHSILLGLQPTEDHQFYEVAFIDELPMTEDINGKKLASAIITQCAMKLGMAIHICEGWAIKRHVDADPTAERPSQAADKEEVLIITIVHGDEARAFAMHPIITKDGKRYADDAELHFDGEDGFNMGGTLSGHVTKR